MAKNNRKLDNKKTILHIMKISMAEDLDMVSQIFEDVDFSDYKQLKDIYFKIRKGKVTFSNKTTSRNICLFLADIIVDSDKDEERVPIARFTIGFLFIITGLLLGTVVYLNYKTEQNQIEMNNNLQILHSKTLENSQNGSLDSDSGNNKEQKDITRDSDDQNIDNAEIALLDNMKSLYDINNELFGWIKIKGTNVDYPIVHTSNNSYYLNHDFQKNESNAGTLFLDYRNKDESDTNMIVYGHNTQTDTMFGTLYNYRDYDYYESHKYIELDTLYKKYRYKVISVCNGKVAYENEDVYRYYNFTNASDEQEFNAFFENVKKQQSFDTGYEPNVDDTFLTLSTCSNYIEDGRLYIVAVKVED